MGDLKHLSVHQWIRSAIPDSQQPTSPIGFLFFETSATALCGTTGISSYKMPQIGSIQYQYTPHFQTQVIPSIKYQVRMVGYTPIIFPSSSSLITLPANRKTLNQGSRRCLVVHLLSSLVACLGTPAAFQSSGRLPVDS